MIEYISTDREITLFWEKESLFVKGCFYIIFMNNKRIGKSEKTHFTITNLKENSKYLCNVKLIDSNGNELSEEFITCHTIFSKKKINITKPPYNAKGDGNTLNTFAIQKAIDDCKENECVYIPAGDFMTGALKLHSNMEIYIEKGGILHGTENVEDYLPKIQSRFEGIEMICYSSLINIGELSHNDDFNCKNVTIRGEGRICSGGSILASNIIETEKNNLKKYIESLGDKISEFDSIETIPGRMRPRLINISNSQNVILSGLILENGASWNVHMIYSDNVITNNCTFRSEKIHNGDGWDPDSSTNCTIFNCNFYTGDDAIAIKSGKNPEGNEINRPCKHIRIFDCVSYAGHGITIGSEMSGGVEDVSIWDCNLVNSAYGFEVKATKKRGGYVKKIFVRDTCVSRILIHSVPYNDDGIPAETLPLFENLTYENIDIILNSEKKPHAIIVEGFDEKEYSIKNVCFKNITISSDLPNFQYTTLFSCCQNIKFDNIICK